MFSLKCAFAIRVMGFLKFVFLVKKQEHIFHYYIGKKTERESVHHKNLKVSTADTMLFSKVRRDNGEGPLL